MGLSGETFRLLFDQADPERGMHTVAHNPLRAVAGALGYDCEVHSTDDPASALDLLTERLEAGPAIMRLEEQWVVVDREPGAGGGFRVTAAQGKTETWDRERIQSGWGQEPGLLELGLAGHYLFQLGEKQRDPDHRDAAVGSIRRGIRLMTRRAKVNGCAAGLAAYEDMQRAFRRPRRDPWQWRLDLSKFLRWRGAPLAAAAGSRHAANRFLQLIAEHFEPDTREHLGKAAQKYERVAEMLEHLPELPAHLVPPLDRESHEPLSPEERRAVRAFAGIRRKSARVLKRAHRLEQEAVDELRRALDTVDRKKNQ